MVNKSTLYMYSDVMVYNMLARPPRGKYGADEEKIILFPVATTSHREAATTNNGCHHQQDHHLHHNHHHHHHWRDRGAKIQIKQVPFGVFSTSHYAPAALSSDLNPPETLRNVKTHLEL